MIVTPALMFVPAERIREYWPDIRDRVAALAAAPGEKWCAEDVYHDILMGGADLFVTGDLRGFVVTQFLKTPYSRTLHVWIAHNVGLGNAAGFFEQLKSIAKANDCTDITFVSDRPGFKRAIPGIRAATIYSFDVGD